ncbi:MAG: hypothetical protein WC761_00350 [Candidatus Paceibacterota bacterium]|jgi:hypothetical protein
MKASKLISLMKVGDLFGRGGKYKHDEGWASVPLRFFEVKKSSSFSSFEKEDLWEVVFEPTSIDSKPHARNVVRLPTDDVLVLVVKGARLTDAADGGDFEKDPISDIFWSISKQKLIGIRRSAIVPLETMLETIEKLEGRKKQ